MLYVFLILSIIVLFILYIFRFTIEVQKNKSKPFHIKNRYISNEKISELMHIGYEFGEEGIDLSLLKARIDSEILKLDKEGTNENQ